MMNSKSSLLSSATAQAQDSITTSVDWHTLLGVPLRERPMPSRSRSWKACVEAYDNTKISSRERQKQLNNKYGCLVDGEDSALRREPVFNPLPSTLGGSIASTRMPPSRSS
uniref:Uncharacterized protein n=1 Tax=Rhodosorus marinus TaxID=101924 RepID=A0A7S2ZKT6_9RHOD